MVSLASRPLAPTRRMLTSACALRSPPTSLRVQPSVAVPSITLADGRAMPYLAWGNVVPSGKSKAESTITVAEMAFGTGLHHLDTAEGYNCTPETGAFLSSCDPEGKLFFTTKVSTRDGLPETGVVPVGSIRAKILAMIDQYGRQPDVLLAHSPYLTTSIAELWAVLDEMKDSGELTASLGISNYHPKHIEEVMRCARHKPVVHQLEVHPYVLAHIQPVLDLNDRYGMATTAFGPLAPFASHPTGGPAKPVLERIAARVAQETGADVDGACAALLWLRSKRIGAILGSQNEQRLRRYAATQALPDLTAEEVAQVDQAGRRVYYRRYGIHYLANEYPPPDLPEDA